MLCPEERDHAEVLVPAQHIRGGDLALALGDHPVFHANGFAGMRIRPTGNVACGKNVGIAGLQSRIDKHTAVQTETSGLSELKPRLDADAKDHNLGLNPLAALQNNLLAFDPGDLRPEMKTHPLLGMSIQNQV